MVTVVCRAAKAVSRGRKTRFRSRKKTYYGVRRDILNKIPKSWSNRNVVVRVCGGVARGSCVLIEASSTRPDAMTFRLYSSNSYTPVSEVFCICDGSHDEEKMQKACESVFPMCRSLHPAQLPLDFRRLFTSGQGANEPLHGSRISFVTEPTAMRLKPLLFWQ